jgi:glutathione-regulated potassium-efflux system ancillary protein KefC
MALIVVALLLLKGTLIWLIARPMGTSPLQERPVFTVLLAQGWRARLRGVQAGTTNRVLPADIASLLIGAVAVSMPLGPVLLVMVDKWLLPRLDGLGPQTLPRSANCRMRR